MLYGTVGCGNERLSQWAWPNHVHPLKIKSFVSNKKTTNSKDLKRYFFEEDTQWPTSTWKGAQHHWSLGGCKSTPWWDTTSHPSEWLLLKTATENNKCWQGWGKLEPLCTLVGNVKWYSHFTVCRFLKNLKIELSYDPTFLPLDIYLKELKAGSWRDICTPVFIGALFTVAKMWTELWPVWLIWLEHRSVNRKVAGSIPIRAHAKVVGHMPMFSVGAHTGGSWSLSLSLSATPSFLSGI